MTIKDLRESFRTAAADAIAGESEGTEVSEATDDDQETPGTATPGGEADVSTEEQKDSEAQEGTEVPDSYFGFEFPPDLTPEQRTEIIGELKKRDDQIGKLLRERPDEDAIKPEDVPDPTPELTDAEILQALGLDPEQNPFDEATAKLAVPLVRRQVQQEATIAQLIELQELNEIDRSWRSSLEGLEREFGALPTEVDHESVMEFAADNGINSPVDAYWRIVGPSRATLDKATKGIQARRLAESKRSAASTRPETTVADDDVPPASKTTRGATKEVATKLLKELGLG